MGLTMSRHFPRLLTFVRTLIVFLLLANELSFNWMSRNFFFLMQSTQRKCTCYSYNDSLKDRVLLSSWWLFHLLAKQKQTIVAHSSTKVEYRALANTTIHCNNTRCWSWLFCYDPIHCNNTNAIQIAYNDFFHVRTKHIEIEYHFIHHY